MFPIVYQDTYKQSGYLAEDKKGWSLLNIESINNTFNLGDIFFTLFTFGFIVLILALIVWAIRSSSKRKRQLDRIEEKIDNLNQ